MGASFVFALGIVLWCSGDVKMIQLLAGLFVEVSSVWCNAVIWKNVNNRGMWSLTTWLYNSVYTGCHDFLNQQLKSRWTTLSSKTFVSLETVLTRKTGHLVKHDPTAYVNVFLTSELLWPDTFFLL